ncbi:hypothetical protein A2U01_0073063, partial [Trifolium medium]|nr:hypothetical protein [Trifolium medium]
MDDGTDALDKA